MRMKIWDGQYFYIFHRFEMADLLSIRMQIKLFYSSKSPNYLRSQYTCMQRNRMSDKLNFSKAIGDSEKNKYSEIEENYIGTYIDILN